MLVVLQVVLVILQVVLVMSQVVPPDNKLFVISHDEIIVLTFAVPQVPS